ncbi:hypothetical protein I4U23_026302 [Adineta vaga]|nr:hypothetical protein I4U23_026302 [Adineta vaga]
MAWLLLLLLSIVTFICGQIDDCTLMNPVQDLRAEAALVQYYKSPVPYTFTEIDFFQPQCFHCTSQKRQICASGYKGVETYGIASGSVDRISLVTNLPYIYGLGENVGNISTSVLAVTTLRQPNLTISYRTMLRFKGVGIGNPLLNTKQIVLRLGVKCLAGDTSEHFVTVEGTPYDLTVRLSVNVVENGVLSDLTGHKQARINCATRNVTSISTINSDISLNIPCTNGSCLGPEFCLTYQPEYAEELEIWCPLTVDNYDKKKNAHLIIPSAAAQSLLHIQLERELLNYDPIIFNAVDWFVQHQGEVIITVPEATLGDLFYDPIWHLVLPKGSSRPMNRRIFLLHKCANIRISYHSDDNANLQDTIIFVDMGSNKTFTIREDNDLEAARRSCGINILTNEQSTETTTATSTTVQKPTRTTVPDNHAAVVCIYISGLHWMLSLIIVAKLILLK